MENSDQIRKKPDFHPPILLTFACYKSQFCPSSQLLEPDWSRGSNRAEKFLELSNQLFVFSKRCLIKQLSGFNSLNWDVWEVAKLCCCSCGLGWSKLTIWWLNYFDLSRNTRTWIEGTFYRYSTQWVITIISFIITVANYKLSF